jgi:tetratricopeptide (TPR) repeat protein
VRAYLIILQMPHMQDPRQVAAAVQQATDLFRGAWHAFHSEPTARILYGAMLHEQFLTTGNLEAAQQADIHYLVALNMLGNNPRYKALVLGQLGLLQARARNYRIALGYLQERERLPFPDPETRLVHFLIKAETLAHLEQEKPAAESMEAALKALDAEADLAPYRPLILDRAALYHLAAGQFDRALALYDAEVPLIEDQDRDQAKAVLPPGSPKELQAARNRVVVRLSRAAAALGDKQPQRALADLAAIDEKLADPRLSEALRWPHSTGLDSQRAYRIIAAGLRARAYRALGQLAEAAAALSQQADLLQDRHKRAALEEHLRPLSLAEGQLAELMFERGDAPAAGQWLRKALEHAEEFTRRTKIPFGPDQLALLWLAAELHVKTEGRIDVPLGDRLNSAHARLLKDGTAPQRAYGRLLEMYLPLVGP